MIVEPAAPPERARRFASSFFMLPPSNGELFGDALRRFFYKLAPLRQ